MFIFNVYLAEMEYDKWHYVFFFHFYKTLRKKLEKLSQSSLSFRLKHWGA
jgi:hypothetical protein